MLGNTFSSNCVLLEYALHKKFIAANLCENRGRPEMKCEGKCYLCKRINKENSKDQEGPGHRVDFKFQLLSLVGTSSFDILSFEPVPVVRPSYTEALCNSFSPSFLCS